MPKFIQPQRSNTVGMVQYAESIARSNPALAWAMIRGGFQLPQVFKLSARLPGAIDGQVTGSTRADNGDQGFCSDFVIVSAKFQIRANNAFSGSIWKGQSDYYTAKNSGLDVKLRVTQCPKFDLVPNQTPIELVCQAADADETELQFPYGFVAPECSDIEALFTDTRGFPPSYGPVDVFIAFKGFSLGCGLETIDLTDAVKGLAGAGINLSSVIVGP